MSAMIKPESLDFKNTLGLPSHGGLVEVDGQIIEVVMDDAENAACMADGGVNGVTFLDQTELAVQVPHIRGVHQFVTDGAHEGKETIFGEPELPVGVNAGITLERELVGVEFHS